MGYEVQQTRWDRLVRRVSGSIGPGSRVSETLSELFPVMDVERVPAELLVLGGTRMAWGGDSLGGVAAQFTKIQLFNPADSGNIVTVTHMYARIATAGILRVALEELERTTDAGTARYRDGRFGKDEFPVAQLRIETDASQITQLVEIHLETDVTFPFSDQNAVAVLSPGTGIVFGPSVANISLTGSLFWRERPAEESELSL